MYIHANYNLKQNNTFHFSVKARYFIEIKHASAIPVLRKDPVISSLPWMMIGAGSNLLISEDIDSVVLKCIYNEIKRVKEDDDSVWLSVGAGCDWHNLVRYTVNQGWWGLENLALIPGTMGGAVVQNIGAFASEIQDVITRIQTFDLRTGERTELRKNECAFGYRDSIFKHALAHRSLIHRVTIRLKKQPQPNLVHEPLHEALLSQYGHLDELTPRMIYDQVIALRNQRIPDPNVIGSAGSFFKNPIITDSHYQTLLADYPDLPSHRQPDGSLKVPAGWLIEKAGWKGRKHKNVGVHDRHALILVNLGQGTGAEALELAQLIHDDIVNRFAISLEREVVVI